MRIFIKIVFVAFWLGYGVCAYIITDNSLLYFEEYGRWMPFLLEKGEVADFPWYFPALKVHMIGGSICLAVVILQFFPGLLKRVPKMHKWMGSFYGFSVFFLLCLPGMPMAIYAKGGLLGQMGFLILGALTLWVTWMGVQTARRRKFKAHREWMIRSFALVASAVSFRLFQIGLYYAGMGDTPNYVCSLYLSTFGNLALAEIFIASTRKPKTKSIYENEHTLDTDNRFRNGLSAITSLLFFRGRKAGGAGTQSRAD